MAGVGSSGCLGSKSVKLLSSLLFQRILQRLIAQELGIDYSQNGPGSWPETRVKLMQIK